ncbi:MAG: glycosyltransferase family 39 protein [Acidobacteriota bacterium]
MRRVCPWMCTAAGLGLVAGFARLPESGLRFLDSWCYARVSVEMLLSGDWVVPSWQGEVFLEKPPLLFWLTALIYRITGVSEFGASVLAGASVLGCVLIVYLLGARAAGRPAGLMGAVLLCLLPMFIKWGRTYTTDPLFTLLCMAALACAWYATQKPHTWPAAGALAAFAVLSRGAATLPLLMALAVLICLQGQGVREPRRRWVWGGVALLLFLAIVVPWHWLAYERTGDLFLDTYVGVHTVQRLQSNLIDSARADDPIYYLKHLARTGWPGLAFILWGLVRLKRAWRPCFDPAGLLDRTLLAYLACQVVMLAVVASRSPRYLLPLYPPLALLAARGLVHGINECASERLRRWSAAGLVLATVVIAVWPGTIGTPRGRPFRSLAQAVEPMGADIVLGVDPALRDPWFDRAFWFYLGRSPGSLTGAGVSMALPERRLRIVPLERASACEPPACRVLKRAAPLALTAVDITSIRSLGGEDRGHVPCGLAC